MAASQDAEALVAELTDIIAKLQLKLGSEKARKLVRRIVDDLGAPERKPKE
jgi:hypothetical protein